MIRRRMRESLTLHFVRPSGEGDWMRGIDIDDLRLLVRRFPIHWISTT